MPSLFCTEPAYFLTLFQEPGSLTRAAPALQKLGVTAGNRVDQNVLVFSEMRIRLTWSLRPVNSSSKPHALEGACHAKDLSHKQVAFIIMNTLRLPKWMLQVCRTRTIGP